MSETKFPAKVWISEEVERQLESDTQRRTHFALKARYTDEQGGKCYVPESLLSASQAETARGLGEIRGLLKLARSIEEDGEGCKSKNVEKALALLDALISREWK